MQAGRHGGKSFPAKLSKSWGFCYEIGRRQSRPAMSKAPGAPAPQLRHQGGRRVRLPRAAHPDWGNRLFRAQLGNAPPPSAVNVSISAPSFARRFQARSTAWKSRVQQQTGIPTLRLRVPSFAPENGLLFLFAAADSPATKATKAP